MKRAFSVSLVLLAACSPVPTPSAEPSDTAARLYLEPTMRARPPRSPQARAAASKGDCVEVRRLLGVTVMSGEGNEEEVSVVKQCCRLMADEDCADVLKKKYPELRPAASAGAPLPPASAPLPPAPVP